MAKTEKKIFVERGDDLKKTIELLINNSAERVVLNVPRNSILGGKLNNFEILKKECEVEGKELVVESVDDHILELAGMAQVSAINPIFKTRGRVVSDILPKSVIKKELLHSALEKQSPKKEIKQPEIRRKDIRGEPFILEKIKSEKIKSPRIRKKINFQRTLVFTFVILLGLFGVFELATEILPKATIIVTLKKIESPFNEKIRVSSDTVSPSFGSSSIVLPGELLVAKKNIEMSFTVESKKSVEAKAGGTLTIYNAFSAQSQSLVQNTRFLSPEGKIFRLNNKITIPGAKVVNGEIVPSKIEAEVTADETGEAYNLPASSMWRIPGFQGTPKYDGFYAEAVKPLTGGFIGERAEPGDDDLEKAKAKIESALQDSLKNEIRILMKDKFKTVPGAQAFKILKEEIQPTNDDSGKFSIFAEGEMRMLVFEEETLKGIIAEKEKGSIASDIAGNLRINKFELSYGNPEIDLENGKMTLPAEGKIIFESDIDAKKIAEDIRGRNEENLKATIFSLPGLEKANIRLWPFWVKKVPERQEKINLILE